MGKNTIDEEEKGNLPRKNSRKTNERADFEGNTQISLVPRAHRKCVSNFEKIKKKKLVKRKTSKKRSGEIVQFIDGIPNDPKLTYLGSSCGKVFTDTKRKGTKYNTEIRILDHKFIQCNINEAENCTGAVLPEEIKPLLINVTFLLHELKQNPESKTEVKLCDLISKIVDLVTELLKRPIKKFDKPKPFDDVADKLSVVLAEHDGPEAEEYEYLVREIEMLEPKLIQKNSDVNYVKEQIRDEKSRLFSVSDDVNENLRGSIIKNQSLKAEIRFNKMQLKKYSKIMLQKERRKLKSNAELNILRKKFVKQQGIIENANKTTFHKLFLMDDDVFHDGSVTKYIKSKVVEDKNNVKKMANAKSKKISRS